MKGFPRSSLRIRFQTKDFWLAFIDCENGIYSNTYSHKNVRSNYAKKISKTLENVSLSSRQEQLEYS
jgi:hypothetical protein